MNWYLAVIKNYTGFSGRARRREYWMFALFNTVFAFVALILDNVLSITIGNTPYGPLYVLYVLAVFIPGLAVSVRRLHDIGKSGWMILISLIPFIGGIWLLVLMATDSDSGENEYGPSPKQIKDEQLISTVSKRETIILLIVVWIVVSRFLWVLMYKFTDSHIEVWFELFNGLSTLIWAIIPIGLAFTVNDKLKQVILFVLGGIYFIYGIYEAFKLFVI